MRFVTRRLILRLITIRDIKDLVRNINNLRVSKWLLVVPYPYTTKDAKWWVSHSAEKAKEKPRTDYGFNIELREETSIIGGIGITKIDRYQGTASVGYWLGEDYWGQGYGSEALEKMLDLAFRKLKLRRLEAEVFAGNKASAGLLKKFGFRYEGTTRESARCKATGKIHDAEMYSLLAKEYKRRR